MNMCAGINVMYVLYWLFLVFIVWRFEARSRKMIKSLKKIQKACDTMKEGVLRGELLHETERGAELRGMLRGLNSISSAVNEAGISDVQKG